MYQVQVQAKTKSTSAAIPLWKPDAKDPHRHSGPLLRTRRGNRHILTVQCSFTKWTEAFPIPNQRATTCAKLVKNLVCRFGVSDSIRSEQDRNFESQVFEQMCHMLEIKKTRSTAYYPEGNGQVENIHKTLKSMARSRVKEKPESQDEHLDYCMMAYRSSVYASQGILLLN